MSDVLVLGAGTAGSVLTRRLLDAGLTVTLVEAGGMDTNPAIHDLSRVGELWAGPENWGWYSTPQPQAPSACMKRQAMSDSAVLESRQASAAAI